MKIEKVANFFISTNQDIKVLNKIIVEKILQKLNLHYYNLNKAIATINIIFIFMSILLILSLLLIN